MTGYSELVRKMRTCIGDKKCFEKECRYWSELGCMDGNICCDAADAIEALQAEVYEANKSADAYRSMYFAKHGDITIEKVRELDEIDYHFHSALIRLMYRRIEELEAQLRKQGDIVRCGECKWYDPLDRTRPFFCPVMDCATGVMEDDFCSRGERRDKMEPQE